MNQQRWERGTEERSISFQHKIDDVVNKRITIVRVLIGGEMFAQPCPRLANDSPSISLKFCAEIFFQCFRGKHSAVAQIFTFADERQLEHYTNIGGKICSALRRRGILG